MSLSLCEREIMAIFPLYPITISHYKIKRGFMIYRER